VRLTFNLRYETLDHVGRKGKVKRMFPALIDPKRKGGGLVGRCFCLMAIAGALQFVVIRAWAEGPGCTKDDLARADRGIPGDAIERRTKAVFGKLQECKGRLTQWEEANVLQNLLFHYTGCHEFPPCYGRMDACRVLAEKGIHLDLDHVGSAGQLIAELYGSCGGDCSKIVALDARSICEKDRQKVATIQNAAAKAVAKSEIIALGAKKAYEVELEQAVSCDPRKARKTIALMDQKGFRDQGRRFIQKYRITCDARMSQEFRVALANDEAVLHFHDDDDMSCMRTLASLPDPVSEATAWNRALCGGTCTLEAGRCASVSDTRQRAIAGRELRTKRRQVTQALCWDCKQGAPCKPPLMKDGRSAGGGIAISWDLKTKRDVALVGDVGRSSKLHWIGDLNGDGIGDLVVQTEKKVWLHEYVIGNTLAEKLGYKDRPIRYRIFDVWIGCGANADFHNTWTQETNGEPYYRPDSVGLPEVDFDHFDLRVEKKSGSDIPSVCVRDAESTGDPVRCLDLSDWENVLGATRR
jgi:hypothetical protein